jgi:hypothetical protein
MKHLLVSLLLLVSAVSTRAELVTIQIPGAPPGLSITVGTGANALPLQDIRTNPNAVNITTHDDSYNNVPLGFDFPFFGRVFNNSWAMTNGLVTFQDPAQSGLGGACCSGVDLRTTTDPRYNYTIYGMHTDLYSWNGQNQYYLREGNSMTYGWYGVSQCCSSNGGNSFEIKINSAGLVDTRIAGARVEYNAVTSGMAGNLANGEYFQAYHGQGINITPGGPSIFSWQAPNGTGAVDMCIINPMSSPTCPGYQAAYTVQQCTVNALFDPSCPGYQTAYFTQQCSTNPLYSQSCPGYQAAYLEQQCSINPLYSTTCRGYQQAYHDQQCSINTLYATDCPGYAQAYLDQQCSANPLYSTTCSGYAAAYKTQQCSLNALFATDCPGYEQAYLNSQCIIDSLYSNKCEGYATAYAIKYLVANIDSTAVNASLSNTAATKANDPTNTVVATNTASTTVSSDGTVSTGVSTTGDSNIDKVIAAPRPTSTSGNQPAAAVQLTAPPPPPQQMAQNEPKGGGKDKQEDKRDDTPKSAGGGNSPSNSNNAQASSDKPAAPTARQELQAKREAAAKAEAVEKGKNLAGEMGKASDLEAQKQVQNVVIQAMGFTPGFDTYSKQMIVQQQFYKPFTVYDNQKNIDNRANLRMFGGTDRLHQEIVDSQYNRKD